MKKILNNIKKYICDFFIGFKSAVFNVFEEFNIIIRNSKYSSRYPVLFALFSILEHEQSAHIFEVNGHDFHTIKNKIFPKDNINNSHILEALLGLFQNHKPIVNKNLAKIKIADYLFDKIQLLINANNRYFEPLIRATLHGFPFLLNYRKYGISRQIINKKSRMSLRMLKYILDRNNFPDFLQKESDLTLLIKTSLQCDNKSAFMILMRYLRQNNLIHLLFEEENNNILAKILCEDFTQKKGLEYASILIAYTEDERLKNRKTQKIFTQFLQNIFSHQLSLKKKEKIVNYYQITTYVTTNYHLGYQNSKISKIVTDTAERFVSDFDINSKISQKTLKKYIRNSQKPATSFISIRGFFSLSPRFVEEYWLLKNAPYLL